MILLGGSRRRTASDDVDAVLELLTDQSWLAMPPADECYIGRVAVGDFLRASAIGRGEPYELVPTRAAGLPAYGCYLRQRARGLIVIALAPGGGAIDSMLRFLDDNLHRRFGMPDLLSG